MYKHKDNCNIYLYMQGQLVDTAVIKVVSGGPRGGTAAKGEAERLLMVNSSCVSSALKQEEEEEEGEEGGTTWTRPAGSLTGACGWRSAG